MSEPRKPRDDNDTNELDVEFILLLLSPLPFKFESDGFSVVFLRKGMTNE